MPNVTVTLTGDEQRALRALQRLQDQERKLAESASGVEKATHGAGKAHDGAFGQKALGQIIGMASGFASVTMAINTVKQALVEVDQQSERLASKQREAQRGMSSLAQLTGGDAGKFRELTGAARRMYAQGGAETLDQAARTVFSLESAGALESADLFARLSGIVEDPAVMARAATTLMTSRGRAETGGIQAILSKAMAASKYSPASAEALLEAGAAGGGYAKLLGVSDEELMAATAVMATATGGAETGGTTVASLLAALTKKGGFKGLTIGQSIQKIQGMGMADEDLVKYLGRKEAFTAYSTLSGNLGQLGVITRAQQVAERDDLIGQVMRTRESDPMIMAARRRQMAEAQRELAGEMRGTRRNILEGNLEALAAQQEREGMNPLLTWAYQKGARFTRWLPGEEQKFLEANPEGRALLEAAEALKTAADKQSHAQGGTSLGRPTEDR